MHRRRYEDVGWYHLNWASYDWAMYWSGLGGVQRVQILLILHSIKVIYSGSSLLCAQWNDITVHDDSMALKRSTHYWKFVSIMTSSNGNIFRVTGPLCGEFTGPGEFPTQRPVTRSFDVFFDLRLNKRLSKHSWGWWFETLSWSLWRHHNGESGGFSSQKQ